MCFGKERNAGKGNKIGVSWRFLLKKKKRFFFEEDRHMQTGQKERQRDDVKIQSRPENGEV